MKTEKNYEFRKRMTDIHKPNIRDYEQKCSSMQFELKDGCVIKIPQNSNDVIITAARDLVDFLFISMGISARLCKNETTHYDILLSSEQIDLYEANGYKGYQIAIDNKIIIHAFDDRGAAQAFYRLEDIMRLNRAPFLEKGIFRNKPLFTPQMVHSGFGLDQYPDSHLAQIAHDGRDAILIFVKDLNITPSGYLDFNDLIYRASKYGIDVYAYSYISCEKHPDEEDAEEFYENTFGKIFKHCPKLKGIVFVGESMKFPSRDKALTTRSYKNIAQPNSGSWPCDDYPALLSMLKNIIRKYNSSADIIFWTYNWGFAPEDLRIKLIENLPTDITLLVTFERYEEYKLGKTTQFCSDYTLARTGPCEAFNSEATAAKKRGIKLYTMSNTSGKTWDFGLVPYLPMPFQWFKRFKQVTEAKKEYNLTGLMESHHYGFYPSIISELSKYAFSTEEVNLEALLEKMIARDYGHENISSVKEALKLWSEAITYCAPTVEDQYGPLRIGPTYPLCFDFPQKPPVASYAHFGMYICQPMYNPLNYNHNSFTSIRILDEIDAFEKLYRLMTEGIQILEKIKQKNEDLERLIGLGCYIAATAKTTIHTKKWYMKKIALLQETDRKKALLLINELEQIANDEIENAKSVLWAVENDSILGWEPSMEYLGDAEHIQWKIKQVENVRDTRLQEFKMCLEK